MSNSHKIKLIKDAIFAAESNIRLAKNLLLQLEGDVVDNNASNSENNRSVQSAISNNTVGNDDIIGVFDGLNLVTDDKKTIEVPRNYISKSMIVEGDTLKKIEEDGESKFKQIRRVKRNRLVGTVMKKDGNFVVVTEKGSYKILPESIEFHKIQESDTLTVLVPSEKKGIWAAVEGVVKEIEGIKQVEEEPSVIKKGASKKKVIEEETTSKTIEQQPQVLFTKDSKETKEEAVLETSEENLDSDEDVLQ